MVWKLLHILDSQSAFVISLRTISFITFIALYTSIEVNLALVSSRAGAGLAPENLVSVISSKKYFHWFNITLFMDLSTSMPKIYLSYPRCFSLNNWYSILFTLLIILTLSPVIRRTSIYTSKITIPSCVFKVKRE